MTISGNTLAVQWLGLQAFTAKGPGSIPGRGTKIPQAVWHSQKKNKGQFCMIQTKIKGHMSFRKKKSEAMMSSYL